MYAFSYHKPASLDDAARLLAQAEDGQYLAGGHTLLPTMKQHLAAPSDLVDLAAIPDLAGIEASGGTLRIGAMTRHADVGASAAVADMIPALGALAGGIGDAAVRNRGTLGGSIANNDPAADYPAAVLGLGATVITNRRQIAGDDFFTGMFETALDEGEIITAVTFPAPRTAAYVKFPNPASRYAIVGVFVARFTDRVRVAVTGAGACVFRLGEAESRLAGDFSPAALDGLAIPADGLNGDIHASAEYRAHLIGVMVRRAVGAAG